MAKRPRGSGSIIVRAGVYYGRWQVGDRQVMRRLGPVRAPGTRQGLTGTMAEARLRELMAEVVPPPIGERVTVEGAGRRHLAHLEAMGRKPSTLRSYRNQFEAQLVLRLGDVMIATLDGEQVEQLVAALAREGLAPKTIREVVPGLVEL
jgi:hypothetical protein